MEDPPSSLGESIAADDVPADLRQQPFESLFEQRVFLAIRRRGYHVTPQFPVGRRRIDLVVSGHSGRLAVECDGRVAHSTPDQIRDDMERERELRRVGWKFCESGKVSSHSIQAGPWSHCGQNLNAAVSVPVWMSNPPERNRVPGSRLICPTMISIRLRSRLNPRQRQRNDI